MISSNNLKYNGLPPNYQPIQQLDSCNNLFNDLNSVVGFNVISEFTQDKFTQLAEIISNNKESLELRTIDKKTLNTENYTNFYLTF